MVASLPRPAACARSQGVSESTVGPNARLPGTAPMHCPDALGGGGMFGSLNTGRRSVQVWDPAPAGQGQAGLEGGGGLGQSMVKLQCPWQ